MMMMTIETFKPLPFSVPEYVGSKKSSRQAINHKRAGNSFPRSIMMKNASLDSCGAADVRLYVPDWSGVW